MKETIYKEGAMFKSKKQSSFKVIATGQETISTFECCKISNDGSGRKEFRNFNKDFFELIIIPTEIQAEIKKVLFEVSKNISAIARDLEKMKDYDVICALGGNISLIENQYKKIKTAKPKTE